MGPPPIDAVLTDVRLIQGWTVAPDGTLYLSVLYPDDKTEIAAIDPAAGSVLRRTDAKGSGDLAFAAGSLWAAEFDGDLDCSVSRLDPQTFAVQATIDTPCDIFGTTIVASGDAPWFIDRSLNAFNNVGVRRIDPRTNQPGDPVQLPFFNGYLSGTPQALVYGDEGEGKGWYRLPAGSTTLQSLGQRSAPIYAVNGGLWDQDQFQTAFYYTNDGDPVQSIDFDGILAGADDQAIYVDKPVAEGSQLWRYPVDGGDPQVIGQSPPDYDNDSFYYADNSPFITTGSSIVKVWLTNGSDTAPSAVFVQVLPTQ
jgi:hypothetical protein